MKVYKHIIKIVHLLALATCFVGANSTGELTSPSDGLEAASPKLEESNASSNLNILRFRGENISEFPKVFKSFSSPLFEVYWDFSACKQENSCKDLKSQRPVDVDELSKIEKRAAKVLREKMEKFDAWASQNLEFWSTQRGKTFPVRLVLNASQDADSIAVTVGDITDRENFLKPVSQKRPQIGMGIRGLAQNLNYIDETVPHEFGHALQFSMGYPQYSSPFEETIGDLVFQVIEDGKPNFAPKLAQSTAADIRKAMRENPEDKNYQEFLKRYLRMASPKGLRDFTTDDNISFFEAHEMPNSYFTSSLVNRTFFLLRREFTVDEISKAVLDLLNEKRQVLMNPDLSVFGREIKARLKSSVNGDSGKNRLLDEVFEQQKWSAPAGAPVSTRVLNLKETENYGRTTTILYDASPPMLHNDGVQRTQIVYAGGKLFDYGGCRGGADCSTISSMHRMDECHYFPCSCVDRRSQISFETLFIDEASKQIKKTPRKTSPGLWIEKGCYHFG